MTVTNAWKLLPPLTTATVTVAVFAKSFIPFIFVGSTVVFAVACLAGMALVAIAIRALANQVILVPSLLVALALIYCAVIASFLLHSLHRVPATHLLGILTFHGLFLLFGFAASRAVIAVLAVLGAMATIYVLVIAQYVVKFGDFMRDRYLQDVFGVGIDASITFHQNIGSAIALGTIAAFGLFSRRRLFVFAALPFVFWFLFHIAARTAIVALVSSLLFWAGAVLWNRSWKLATLSLAGIVVFATIATGLFYQRAIHDKTVDAVASDAISRTIREIQDPRPLYRTQIWTRAVNHIVTEPDKLLFGRGIGVYPIDEGFGSPNWLLKPTEGNMYYPHNIYLDVLYEAGLAGLLPVIALTLLPLCISLGRWNKYGTADQASILLYVFYFVAMQISGSFAFSYVFQFFLGLAIGVVALSRKKDRGVPSAPIVRLQS